jgi:DNA-directed RNA polymerase specialized sigma24 family protein
MHVRHGGTPTCIATLPLDQRTSVVLHYWGGLRDHEIAEAMGTRAERLKDVVRRVVVYFLLLG